MSLIFIIFSIDFNPTIAFIDHFDTLKAYKEMDRQDKEAARTNTIPEYQRTGVVDIYKQSYGNSSENSFQNSSGRSAGNSSGENGNSANSGTNSQRN